MSQRLPLIRWKEHWPEPIRRDVEPHVRRFLWLAPSQVRELWLYYSTDEQDGPASVVTCREYATVKIRFGAQWMETPEDEKGGTIVHEFCHVIVDPLVEVCDDLCAEVEESNPRLAERMRCQLKRAMERATTDLEGVVCDRLGDQASAAHQEEARKVLREEYFQRTGTEL